MEITGLLIILLIVVIIFIMSFSYKNPKLKNFKIKKETLPSQKLVPIEYRHDYPFPYEDVPYEYQDNQVMEGLTTHNLVEVPRAVVSKGNLKFTSDKYLRGRDSRREWSLRDYSFQGYHKIPHVTSMDAELADNTGFLSVNTPWDKSGIVTSVDELDNTILTLYKRAIDPYREWYEYQVEDKHGIIIPLGPKTTHLENGDIIEKIIGKEGKGAFKVNLFDNDKYVYI